MRTSERVARRGCAIRGGWFLREGRDGDGERRRKV